MDVLDDLELVLVDDGAALAPQIEAQQRQQLVVERFRDAKVLDRDLDVVDDGLGHVPLSTDQPQMLRQAVMISALAKSMKNAPTIGATRNARGAGP